MRDYYEFPELRLQAVEQSPEAVQPPISDLAARLALMRCDDPTDPDLIGIESYMELVRKH